MPRAVTNILTLYYLYLSIYSWGHYTCDGRRPISQIYPEFPDVDFSEVNIYKESFNT